MLFLELSFEDALILHLPSAEDGRPYSAHLGTQEVLLP